MRRVVAGVVGGGALAWVLAAAGLDLAGGSQEPHDVDLIVVAGANVLPSGEAGPSLRARTELAIALYRDGKAPRLAFTGGVGDHPPSEADVGAALARAAGVPDEALVLEKTSTSTEENARHLAAIVGPETRIALVTDRYHVWRARRVFARHFRHVVGIGAISPTAVRGRGALREVLAVLWYGARGRLRVPDPPP